MLQRVQVHASWAVVMGVHRWCCGRAWAHSLCCCGTAVGQGLGVVKCTPLGLLAPAPSAAAVRERAGAQLRPRRQRGPSQEAGVVTVGELPFTATESLPFFFFFSFLHLFISYTYFLSFFLTVSHNMISHKLTVFWI